MSEQEDYKIMFLLGAGASLPAGLADVMTLTKMFFKSLDESDELDDILKDKTRRLSNSAFEHFAPRQDLESIMTLVGDLNNGQQKKLFQSTYNQLETFSDTELKEINNFIHNYLRHILENVNADSVNYLLPLLGFRQKYDLEIFTLNYDGVLDIFLNKSGVDYSDGFSPFWSPNLFDDNMIPVKIYRLHGSLFWFKIPNGKAIRIPIRGVEIKNIKYISGEDMDEMLIYPTLTKEKHFEIYTFLSNRFISKLRSSHLCVVIGYSFRDKDLTDILIEGLQNNQNLWIIIVSPAATNHKPILAVGAPEMNSRIICLDFCVEDIMRSGKLYRVVEKLRKNISDEKLLWIRQLHSEGPSLWNSVLNTYYTLGAVDRIAYIRNKLVAEYGVPDEDILRDYSKAAQSR
jgi:hypothetical protein